VYSGVVGRTQIYLTDAELDLLDREAEATGASRSELIRRAVRAQYAPRRRPPLASAGIVSDGSWSSDTIDDELAQIFEERYRRWHG
jgi:hypothetical protein